MIQSMRFQDRRDAGRRLAERLRNLAGERDVIVLGLPRGGVPVGYEVASRLRAALDAFVVRKLGVPGHEELAMGAVASGGLTVLNPDVIDQIGIPRATVEAARERELREIERRERLYRGDRPAVDLAGKTVVLVDDGIATGATMASAVGAVRVGGASRVIVAAPVMSQSAVAMLAPTVDRCEYVVTPEPFYGVGAWYLNFEQTSDDEVLALLEQSQRQRSSPAASPSGGYSRGVRIPAKEALLHGDLTMPAAARGIVVFAHGSGSSRFSPRNMEVAATLNEHGYATLLFDLLTNAEEAEDRFSGRHRFDIGLLASRLVIATDWLAAREDTATLPLAYFGASTGAAAALVAASARPALVRAVISRGGRPDLAGDALGRVRAPTLLIVGGNDREVLALNQSAQRYLRSAESEIAVVPGASHLFEEPGALEHVSRLATEWLEHHLTGELTRVAV